MDDHKKELKNHLDGRFDVVHRKVEQSKVEVDLDKVLKSIESHRYEMGDHFGRMQKRVEQSGADAAIMQKVVQDELAPFVKLLELPEAVAWTIPLKLTEIFSQGEKVLGTQRSVESALKSMEGRSQAEFRLVPVSADRNLTPDRGFSSGLRSP